VTEDELRMRPIDRARATITSWCNCFPAIED
jgi:hypothetical protein